jgi:hypothetical protein
MPRPQTDLNPYQDFVIEHFLDHNMNPNEIASALRRRHGLRVNGRTIQRRLHNWNVRKRARLKDNTALFKERLKFLFYQKGMNDREIIKQLNNEGWGVSQRTVKAYRQHTGILLRVNGKDKEKADAEALAIVQGELQKGTVQEYGRTFRQSRYRSLGKNLTKLVS